MPRDPRVDAYIARQADFARPILEHIRSVIHSACADVEETIKWGMPFFAHKKRPIANMAAFKAHATFGFWDSRAAGSDSREGAMGQMGRLTRIDDLPDDKILAGYVRKAIELRAAGPAPRQRAALRTELDMPGDLQAALDKVPAAHKAFAAFSPSARREYIEWVTEAKQPATRDRRIAQSVEWIAEGKRRNWKYERS
jgi:uncharacterized protein YdeI (YjbR/CyaY-like superfamily)